MLSRAALLAVASHCICCLQTTDGLLLPFEGDDEPLVVAQTDVKAAKRSNASSPTFLLSLGDGNNHVSYNVEDSLGFRVSSKQPPQALERFAALLYVMLFAVAPVTKMCQDAKAITPFVAIHATLMLVVFLGSLMLFTHVVEFLAPTHFGGRRCLTIGEAIYFMSVILGTVGYGDIYPADYAGQVVVTMDVMFVVLLYANVLISQGIKMLKELKLIGHDTQDLSAFGASAYHKHHEDLVLPWRRVASSVMLYLATSGMGVLFYHYYPGEEKTWWESIHLTVITFTTVGLGDIVPATGVGMLFAAFWILFGVMSFTVFVGSFAGLLLAATKRSYRALRKPAQDKLLGPSFPVHLETEYQAVPQDQYEFLKFHLLQLNMASEADVLEIEKAFQVVKGTRC